MAVEQFGVVVTIKRSEGDVGKEQSRRPATATSSTGVAAAYDPIPGLQQSPSATYNVTSSGRRLGRKVAADPFIRPEHQQLIVDAGALPHLVALLKRHRDGQNSRAVNGVIRRATDAITNLAHENSNIKTRVRSVRLYPFLLQFCVFQFVLHHILMFKVEGGIPPLVELLEFIDAKIVDCNALPTLNPMLRSEDATIHYEAVGVIGNLLHSSPNIKKEVLLARALQPVTELLSLSCSENQREVALLLG
ncbi:unnamed protein product [Lactuca virosa]|uniref:Uncharacterized protein n=1 Tax=Lactuca virosa TaxID=75947 RepID=A0AAU9LM26_9ASTR|nr:unnamed protein product [Lactuca virosa]